VGAPRPSSNPGGEKHMNLDNLWKASIDGTCWFDPWK
jgi:hypothetical protein